MLTLITPTGDRPLALQNCARWMSRQTYAGDVQWLIVDDGHTDYQFKFERPGWKVTYTRRRGADSPSIGSFVGNLIAAAELADGDKVLVIEDDDYYHPTHVEDLAGRLDHADAAGHEIQMYYYLPTRRWTKMNNKGSCLCQTGFRSTLLDTFIKMCRRAMACGSRGVDAKFWAEIRKKGSTLTWDLYRGDPTVIGLKGYPGRPGLGIGHRPERTRGVGWHHDATGDKLREWLGDDANLFKEDA